MFHRLYKLYDQRFVYQAPALKLRTQRLVWGPESTILTETILRASAFGEMTPRIDSHQTGQERV
jgi:hypothetical protein